MRLSTPLLAIIWAILLLLFIAYQLVAPVDRKWTLSNRFKLPPGPRGLPLIGNWLSFSKQRSQGKLIPFLLSLRSFGEMTTLHMGSHVWVVLNTTRVVDEIIAKRASLTSERPHMPVSSGLVSHGRRSVLQLSKPWSESRRMLRPLLQGPWTETFAVAQDIESVQMLVSYLRDPSKWYMHQSRYATGVLHRVVAGTPLTKTDEELQEYRRLTMEFLGSFYATVVDFFPCLELLPRPLQLWRHKWEAVGLSHLQVFDKWWRQIKTDFDNGIAETNSWVQATVLNPDMGYKGSERDAIFLTNSLISAGGDNPRMALNIFAMACVACPDQARKAREEMDGFCGTPTSPKLRLPSVEDMSSVPYVCAFVKELLRWRPVVPLIPPHQLTEDLTFEGYVFPKGTNFLINTVATCAECEDPGAFRPERWLDGNETRLTHGYWGFGGGRRVCIGYKAAQPGLFLAVSRLLYCFDFESRGECDTKSINHWSEGEPFPVRVSARSAAHERLILDVGASKGLC